MQALAFSGVHPPVPIWKKQIITTASLSRTRAFDAMPHQCWLENLQFMVLLVYGTHH